MGAHRPGPRFAQLEHPVRQADPVDRLQQGLGVRGGRRPEDHDLHRPVQQLVAVDEGRKRHEIALEVAGESGDQGFGPFPVAVLSGQVVEPGEHPRHDRVAGRHGAVVRRLGAHDELFGIVGGQEIAAAFGVPVVPVQHLGPGLRLAQIGAFPGRFGEQQGGLAHLGVVVERGRVAEPAVAPGVPEPAVLGHVPDDEGKGGLGGGQPGGLAERRGGARQRRDHQAVPVGQHLVVPARPHPRAARRQEPGAQLGQLGFLGGLSQPRAARAVEDGLALPVAARGHVVGGLERRRVGAQQRVDLGLGPDVEPALLALAVGVEGTREGARRRAAAGLGFGDHLAQDPADGLAQALLVERVGAVLPGPGQEVDHLGVVVEHLLEVRHQPATVHRVAGKAAAQMVVDAALAHLGERELDGLAVARRAAALPGAPEQFQNHRLRELRRMAEAALDRIDLAERALGRLVGGLGREGAGARAARELVQRLLQGRHALGDAVPVLGVDLGDALQDLRETGPAEARFGRKVGAAPERLAVGGQKHGQRPAAVLAEQGDGLLVDGVDVRAFLAVDLDVDEQRVHLRGDGLVLEGFVRHDVAPVTGRVADRQQDRLVGLLGRREGRGVPGLPGDRIGLVLQQVRAGLFGQAVGQRRGTIEHP